jgi:hypothetical protein
MLEQVLHGAAEKHCAPKQHAAEGYEQQQREPPHSPGDCLLTCRVVVK